jgi:hypothetical protein
MKKNIVTLGIIAVAIILTNAPVSAQDLEAPLTALFLSDSNESFNSAPSAVKASARKIHAQGLRINRRKKDKKTTGPSPFIGTWYTKLNQVKNTCAAGLPATLNVGLTIDSKLVGKDKFDGSPFFSGVVLAANKIGFSRSRTANGCTQTQTYVLGNVKGNSGFTALKSETKCGANSCETLYSGPSSRR